MRRFFIARLIQIPTPEFYMFYNGREPQPAEKILKLSDAYLDKTYMPMLQLAVKMININMSAGHPILGKCRSLYEYSYFIQVIRDHIDEGQTRDGAIKRAMEHCVQKGTLRKTIWSSAGFKPCGKTAIKAAYRIPVHGLLRMDIPGRGISIN